jgi:hypothetical protein
MRPARFGDIPRIIAILNEKFVDSAYNGVTEIDQNAAKSLIFNAIQRHGHKTEGGTFVIVCETNGVVEGFLAAVLQRTYLIGTGLTATDMFFVTTSEAHPRDAGKMLSAMMTWAKGCPKVVEVMMAVTGVMGDWTRNEKMLSRQKLKLFGAVYRKEN